MPVESARRAVARLETARRALGEAIRLDPSLDQPHYFVGLVESSLGRYSEAGDAFARAVDIAVKNERREVSYTSQWARVSMSSLAGALFERSTRRTIADIEPILSAAEAAARKLNELPDGVGVAWYSDPRKEAVAISSTIRALRGDADKALKQLDAALPSDRDPDFTDINLLVARALCGMVAAEPWKSDAQFRGRALLDADRASKLASQDRGAITQTRRITAIETSAMLAHRLSERRDDPAALRAKSRGVARRLLSELINSALQLYHPHEWMWRQMLADTLIDEMLEGELQPQERQTLAGEIRQHLRYAEQMGAVRPRIQALREDLAKALNPPSK